MDSTLPYGHNVQFHRCTWHLRQWRDLNSPQPLTHTHLVRERKRDRETETPIYTPSLPGIIMWEVATGLKPFSSELQQLSPAILVMSLLMGLRPSFPSSSSSCLALSYQKIAESSWHGNASLRPLFSILLARLRGLGTVTQSSYDCHMTFT